MTGRKMRCGLPEHPATIPKGHETLHSRLKTNDSTIKLKIKDYADEKRHTKPSTLTPGDHVLVKQPKTNKLSTPFNPNPLIVTQTKGSMITATNGSRRVVRNSSFFSRVPDSGPIKAEEEEEEEEDEVTLHSKPTPLLQRSPCAPLQKSARTPMSQWSSSPSQLRPTPMPVLQTPKAPVSARTLQADIDDCPVPAIQRPVRAQKVPSYLSDCVTN